jgi:hypothetical protein
MCFIQRWGHFYQKPLSQSKQHSGFCQNVTVRVDILIHTYFIICITDLLKLNKPSALGLILSIYSLTTPYSPLESRKWQFIRLPTEATPSSGFRIYQSGEYGHDVNLITSFLLHTSTQGDTILAIKQVRTNYLSRFVFIRTVIFN